MKEEIIQKINELQINISFLVVSEKNNDSLDKIFRCYNEVIKYINFDNKNITKKYLDFIYDEVLKIDYKNNIYHNTIKNNILSVNKYIKQYLD